MQKGRLVYWLSGILLSTTLAAQEPNSSAPMQAELASVINADTPVEMLTAEDLRAMVLRIQGLAEKAKADGVPDAAQYFQTLGESFLWGANTIAERQVPLFGIYLQGQVDAAVGAWLSKFNRVGALQWLNRLCAVYGQGGMFVLTRDPTKKLANGLGALRYDVIHSSSLGGSMVVRNKGEGNVAGSHNTQVFASVGLLIPTEYLFNRAQSLKRYDYSVTTLGELLGSYYGISYERSTNFKKDGPDGTVFKLAQALPGVGAAVTAAGTLASAGRRLANKLRFQIGAYMSIDVADHYAQYTSRFPEIDQVVQSKLLANPDMYDALKIAIKPWEYLKYYSEAVAKGTADSAGDFVMGKVFLLQGSVGLTVLGSDVGGEVTLDYVHLMSSADPLSADTKLFLRNVQSGSARRIIQSSVE